MAAVLFVHPLVDFHQELEAELRELLAVKSQHRTFPGAGGIEHIVILLLQILCLYILSQTAAQAEADSHFFIGGSHLLHIGLGQPVVGNGIVQHAALLLHLIKDRHIMARLPQIIGSA